MNRFAALLALTLTACSSETPFDPSGPVDYLLGNDYVTRAEAIQFCAHIGGEIATTADDLVEIQALLADEPNYAPDPTTQTIALGWLGDSRETEGGTIYTIVRRTGTLDAGSPTGRALPVCRVPE